MCNAAPPGGRVDRAQHRGLRFIVPPLQVEIPLAVRGHLARPAVQVKLSGLQRLIDFVVSARRLAPHSIFITTSGQIAGNVTEFAGSIAAPAVKPKTRTKKLRRPATGVRLTSRRLRNLRHGGDKGGHLALQLGAKRTDIADIDMGGLLHQPLDLAADRRDSGLLDVLVHGRGTGRFLGPAPRLLQGPGESTAGRSSGTAWPGNYRPRVKSSTPTAS